MVFPSIEFAIFLPVVLVLSWLLMPRPALWKPFILAASYVFYAAASPRYCIEANRRPFDWWRKRHDILLVEPGLEVQIRQFGQFGIFSVRHDAFLLMIPDNRAAVRS